LQEVHVRFSTLALVIGAPLCLVLPGLADNACETIPGNLVANCGFEDGTYTAPDPNLPPPYNTDPGVPNFWFADPGFVEGYLNTFGATDTVITASTGTDVLAIGTGPFGPSAALSQELTDVPGVTYDISGVSVDLGFFDVLIDGDAVFPDSGGTLSFVGSGHDELTLEAFHGQFGVSDVVVVPAGESEVPEPRTTFLISVAMLLCSVWLSRRQRAIHP
jgi:hypothetical protein